MEHIIVKNALLAAFRSAWNGGVDPEQVPLHARVVQGGQVVDSFPEDISASLSYVRGKYLYGGALYNHFGHILQDTIIRLWGYDPDVHDGVIFLPLDLSPKIPQYFYEIIELLGIPKHKCIFICNDSVVEYLDFVKPGNMAQEEPVQEYLDWLKRIDLQVLLDESLPKKILFGRTHIMHQGTYMGESYFNQLLIKNGFYYIEPEKYSIKDQLAFMVNAEKIVFTEGSAIFSLALLSSIRSKVYMMPRRTGGINLFSEWIKPRVATFDLIGDGKLVRKNNRAGQKRPNSPSYLISPRRTFEDLISFGLIANESFDSDYFKKMELFDMKSYFGDDQKLYLQQQNDLSNICRFN